MFLVNSRLGLLSATLFLESPLSLSYGVNLPSSLTTLLSFVLGSSPHLPVSVCGTGVHINIYNLFLPVILNTSLLLFHSPLRVRFFLFPDYSPFLCQLYLLIYVRCRNFYLLSIGYAFRPRLRSRLTLGGRTFPKKP